MRPLALAVSILPLTLWTCLAAEPPTEPPVVTKPDAFQTLVNPTCSHCRDEAKRRAVELKSADRVLSWTRGYSDGGAIPFRFFLNPYRVISDSYGVFVYDPDAGYARGFAPSYDFRFHGWRNGVMVMRHQDGTLYSALTGLAFDGPKRGTRLKSIPALERNGIVIDQVDDEPLLVLWEPKTRSAAAHRPLASQPRKYNGPEPDAR